MEMIGKTLPCRASPVEKCKEVAVEIGRRASWKLMENSKQSSYDIHFTWGIIDMVHSSDAAAQQ